MDESLSVCVPFYPWYREHDRSREVIDTLVEGLNNCRGVKNIELSLTDGGVVDVWGRGRIHYSKEFENEIKSKFNGKLNYTLDERCIHYDVDKTPRFWLSMAVKNSIEKASSEKILILGIDCYACEDLLYRYDKYVEAGTAWIIMPYNVPYGAILEIKNHPGYGWHTAKGITGILKGDYDSIGGFETKFLKNKSDSVFYMKIRRNMNVIERKEIGFYHINHPGSNYSRIWKLKDVIEHAQKN
jgi:hypothetical protein